MNTGLITATIDLFRNSTINNAVEFVFSKLSLEKTFTIFLKNHNYLAYEVGSQADMLGTDIIIQNKKTGLGYSLDVKRVVTHWNSNTNKSDYDCIAINTSCKESLFAEKAKNCFITFYYDNKIYIVRKSDMINLSNEYVLRKNIWMYEYKITDLLNIKNNIIVPLTIYEKDILNNCLSVLKSSYKLQSKNPINSYDSDEVKINKIKHAVNILGLDKMFNVFVNIM